MRRHRIKSVKYWQKSSNVILRERRQRRHITHGEQEEKEDGGEGDDEESGQGKIRTWQKN